MTFVKCSDIIKGRKKKKKWKGVIIVGRRTVSEDRNAFVRSAMAEANIRHWQLANQLGISRVTLQDRLRYELTKEERQKILAAITALRLGKETEAEN